MPPKPKTPCPTPGCRTLTDGGPCPRHAGDRQRQARIDQPWLRFYDTEAWRRMSRRVLLEEPVCRGWPVPGSCTRRSEHADHIVPLRPDTGGARLARENLQGLCGSCHGLKTAAERAQRASTPEGVGGHRR